LQGFDDPFLGGEGGIVRKPGGEKIAKEPARTRAAERAVVSRAF